MTCNLWIRRALSSCLMVAVFATYSMVTLAAPGKLAGDLTVFGNSGTNEAPSILINGESSRSGRTVFAPSTVVTPEGVYAVISYNGIGRIEIAPNTSYTLDLTGDKFGGELTSGSVKILSASVAGEIKTPSGTVTVNSGETATATGKARQNDDDDDNGGAAWVWFALAMGGAVAGILYATLKESNRADLGGGGTVISPTR